MKYSASALFVSLMFSSVAFAESPSVPEFLAAREPARDSASHPPETWSATEHVAWKTDIPGLGWSSPIVWGDKVFLTTCINTGKGRAPKKGLYIEEVDANLYPKETNEHLYQVL